MPELAGSSIIVAGASGGLGAPLSRLLSARGARLTMVTRHEERLRALGTPGLILSADLRDRDAAGRVVEAALDRHGRIDGLINASGVVAFGPLAAITDDALEDLFASNVLGPLRLIRAAIPHLTGGFIVNISAVVAENPVAGMVAYSATKGAMTAADRALARELRREGITVIDVRPPHTETGLAGRPIEGTAPTLPAGLAPERVAQRIITAIEAGEREVPSEAFTA